MKWGIQVKLKRIEEMEQYIRLKKRVSLDELCEVFEVSKNTVRRDVNEIIKSEGYEKVYGGVEFVRNYLLPFEERNQRAMQKKEKIASLAASEIKEGDIVFIDSGTTTQYMPDFLERSIQITVLTNSLNIINKFALFPNVNLIIIGEIFKRKTNSFVGLDKINSLDKYNIHKAFMAATAASVESGLTNSDNQEYDIKRNVVNKAIKKYVLLDDEKFGKSALVTYARLDQMDTIITNEILTDDFMSHFKKSNVVVIYP